MKQTNLSELSSSQLIELVRTSKNKEEIEKGKSYESKLRIITNPYFKNELKTESAYQSLEANIHSTIHKDKAARLIEHFVYPLPVTSITEEILKDLYRVFDGKNRHFAVESESNQDNIDLFLSKAQVNLFIEKHGRQVLKDKPNSVVVLDRSKERGAYPVLVDNDRILDFYIDSNNVFQWIKFLHSTEWNQQGHKVKFIALYDSEKYRVYKEEGSNITLVTEELHNLGYCPARSFMTENANSKTNFRKKVPLLPVIGNLLDWTTYDASKRYIDNYVPFPITEKPISSCNIEQCDGGYIFTDVETTFYNTDLKVNQTVSTQNKEICPECAKSSLLGAGTTVNIDVAQDEEELDSRGVFRFITPDTKGLEYVQAKLDALEAKSHLKATGLDQMLQKEAINEDQVKGGFERAKSVLNGLKVQLELLDIWMKMGLIQLEFATTDTSISSNYGTEWYLLSEEQLQKLFENAKSIGLPEFEIDELYNMLIETKYKSNPSSVKRFKMLNQLSPAPYDTPKEAIEKKAQGALTREDLAIKLNFTRFVKKFERLNGSISKFGLKSSEDQRIESIYKELQKYVPDEQPEAGTSANQA